MRLVVDTHFLIWAAERADRLSPRTQPRVEGLTFLTAVARYPGAILRV